ncbi:hypothetical protein V8F06_005711 [Rhypophila decipiens]
MNPPWWILVTALCQRQVRASDVANTRTEFLVLQMSCLPTLGALAYLYLLIQFNCLGLVGISALTSLKAGPQSRARSGPFFIDDGTLLARILNPEQLQQLACLPDSIQSPSLSYSQSRFIPHACLDRGLFASFVALHLAYTQQLAH